VLDPVLHDSRFILGAGSATGVLWGCLLGGPTDPLASESFYA
jgi:hypothetical protein